jgi:hypothetical protein
VPYLVLSWVDTFWLLLLPLNLLFPGKKCLARTSHIRISSSYNHLLSNLNNLPYLIGISLFISKLHLLFNIWNCFFMSFLPNHKGQMCLSLVTVIATAPHHPRNQDSWHNAVQIWLWQNSVWLKESEGPTHLGLSQRTDFQDLENSCHGADRPFSQRHRCATWFGLFASSLSQESFSNQYHTASSQTYHGLFKLCHSPWCMDLMMPRVILFTGVF